MAASPTCENRAVTIVFTHLSRRRRRRSSDPTSSSSSSSATSIALVNAHIFTDKFLHRTQGWSTNRSTRTHSGKIVVLLIRLLQSKQQKYVSYVHGVK